ncbi:hypothetical protein [Acidocella sp.]|uniref:hypothetical protein n=1 Tax=Acidocella sp. TaxID=50710 RepID=UPI002625000D|nr:hypothetical protein [Acidocella sp.]
MKLGKVGGVVLAACSLVFAAVPPASALGTLPGSFEIGIEPSLFSGHFGTHHQITIYDLPLTLAYHDHGLRVQVEIPYLAMSGAGAIAGASVVPVRGTGTPRQGAGDVWVKLEYRLNQPAGWVPAVMPYAKIKLPVASYNKGLGTGRFDEEGGVRLTWHVRHGIFPYAQMGYQSVGRLPGLHLQNMVTFEPGIAVALTQNQFLSLIVMGHTPVQQRRSWVVSVAAAYNLKLNMRWGLQLYLAHGLTPASPAVGAGVGVMAHF